MGVKMKVEKSKSKDGCVDYQFTSVEGKIGRLVSGENGFLVEIVEQDGEAQSVKFPLKASSTLELDALNSALLDSSVRYERKDHHWVYTDKDIGSTSEYALEILDGSLAGKTYNVKD